MYAGCKCLFHLVILFYLTGILDPGKELSNSHNGPLIEASFSLLAFFGKVTIAAPVSSVFSVLIYG